MSGPGTGDPVPGEDDESGAKQGADDGRRAADDGRQQCERGDLEADVGGERYCCTLTISEPPTPASAPAQMCATSR